MIVDWPLILTASGYVLLEYWLGKTNKVKPGSVLETSILLFKSGLGLFVKDKAQGYVLPPKK